jgi:hypothetical protein
VLFLVRHAHAGDKRQWQAPDDLRPLSLAGQAEAAGLVVRLEDYPIRRILTSPALRCRQTLQPLARGCGLRVEPEVTFGVDAELARVLALLEDLRLQDAVVYPRRGDRAGANPAGRRRLDGRPAVAVAQGVDLADGWRQRAIHACALPAPLPVAHVPEHGIVTGSGGTAASPGKVNPNRYVPLPMCRSAMFIRCR